MLNIFKRIFAQDTLATPQMGEIAASDSALYSGGSKSFRTFNPDSLVGRKSLRIYDEMRIDDQVKFCLALKKRGVIAPGWEIQPTSDDPADIERADFITYVFNNIVGTLDETLIHILSALDYGYSITELVWQQYDSGKYSGRYGLSKLKNKKPHYFTFEIDKYGNLLKDGLVQMLLGAETRLPIDKFVIYTFQREFDNQYGVSDLRTSYRAWWSKDNIIKFWNIYLERFGSPTAVGKYKVNDPQIQTTLQSILTNLQSKTSIVHKDGDFDISLLEAQRRSTADYESALNFHDRAIARGILIPDRVFQAGETGAYSQSQTHFDVFLWVLDSLRKELEETVIQEQIIWRLIDMNYSNVEEAPRFKFRPLTAEQKIELVKSFTDAVQKGALTVDAQDENHIRKILSFPEKSEIEDVKEETPIEESKEEDAPEEEAALAFAKREPTRFEKCIDFKAIEKELDGREEQVAKKAREVLTRQRDALTAFITSKQVNGKLTASLINTGIDLKYMAELKQVFREMFDETHAQGYKNAKAELPKNFALKAKQGIAVTPEKALDYFAAKTDFVVKGIKEPLLRETQGILLNALKVGETASETAKKIEKAYLPYIAEGDVLIDGKQITAHRLETIIRTNMSEAYAWGRREMADETGGYVVGYEFNEILDDRTTEISQYVDGKIISADSPYIAELTYPLHFNDRGMFVFVTKDDLPVDFISEAEALRIIAMMGDFA